MAEMSWLETLEERVREAAAEIRRLRGANEELRAQVKTLETEQKRRANDGEKKWQAERDEVRRRVESLVGQLELLASEEPAEEA